MATERTWSWMLSERRPLQDSEAVHTTTTPQAAAALTTLDSPRSRKAVCALLPKPQTTLASLASLPRGRQQPLLRPSLPSPLPPTLVLPSLVPSPGCGIFTGKTWPCLVPSSSQGPELQGCHTALCRCSDASGVKSWLGAAHTAQRGACSFADWAPPAHNSRPLSPRAAHQPHQDGWPSGGGAC